MNESDDEAAYLTPWYPVADICITNRKHGADEISNTYVKGLEFPRTRAKQGIGSTGVEFR